MKLEDNDKNTDIFKIAARISELPEEVKKQLDQRDLELIENLAKISKMSSEMKEELYKFAKEIIPVSLFYYDLDDLFFEDKREALLQLQEKIAESQCSFLDDCLIADDFIITKKHILKKLDSLNDNDSNEVLAFLFYLVSSFESMVNYHIHLELEIRGLSQDEIEGMLSNLSTNVKLGGLLKVIFEDRYTSNKNWKSLNQLIKVRNYFIHYKPVKRMTYNNHYKILNKELFKNFLDAASDCYYYLMEHHSDGVKNYFNTIERINILIKDV